MERIAATQSLAKGVQASVDAALVRNVPGASLTGREVIQRSVGEGVTLGPAAISVTENPTVF